MFRKIMLPVGGLLAVLIVIVSLIGCSNKRESKKLYDKFIKCKIGEKIDKKSGILRELNSSGKYMYAIEERNENKKSSDKIMIADTENKTCYRYKTESVVNTICNDDKYIYYADTIYDGENISRITKVRNQFNGKKKYSKSKYVDRKSVNGIIFGHISVYKDYLHAYGFDYNEEGVYSKLYVFNKSTMKLIKDISMTDFMIDVVGSDYHDGHIYVTGRSVARKEHGQYVETDSRHIIKIDMEDYHMEQMYVGSVTHHIRCTDSGIYVTGYDGVLDKGNKGYYLSYDGTTLKSTRFDTVVDNERFIPYIIKRLQ